MWAYTKKRKRDGEKICLALEIGKEHRKPIHKVGGWGRGGSLRLRVCLLRKREGVHGYGKFNTEF